MRVLVALAWGGAAAIAAITGCTEHSNSTAAAAPAPTHAAAGVTEPQAQAAPTTPSDRARELVQVAEIQIRDLEDIRASSTDLGRIAAIDGQIVAISRHRDAVLADLGEPQSPRLDADTANLRRAMESAGAVQPQAPQPPPIERLDRPPGGPEALPPVR